MKNHNQDETSVYQANKLFAFKIFRYIRIRICDMSIYFSESPSRGGKVKDQNEES